MPCNERDYEQERQKAWHEFTNLHAALCGIASTLDQQNMLLKVLDTVDWNEAGVSRSEFEAWWDEHKARDAEVKRREAAEKRREGLAQQARAKLTPDELRALYDAPKSF